MNRTRMFILILLVILLAWLLFYVEHADAKDRPLPYTTPHYTQQRNNVVQISWYNTKPGTYTIAQKYERCTPRYCMDMMRIVWRKYVGIGNVRVNDKHSQPNGTYITY